MPETIIIRFGEHDLQKYEFSPKSSVTYAPSYLVEAAHLIKINREPDFDFDAIPEDDLSIFEEIFYGHNDGVYLLERKGATCFFVSQSSLSMEAIINAIALDCPGPLMAGITFDFIERKQSSYPSYFHPKLKPVLKDTFGVALYRKQVIDIASIIAGYTPEEQNELRVTLEDCKPGELNSHKKRFIDGAVCNWIDAATAEIIFKQIAYISSYDYFDEWQASEHAILAYRSAYMRHNYPEDYQTAYDITRHERKTTKSTVIEAPEYLNPLINRLIKARLVGQECHQMTRS